MFIRRQRRSAGFTLIGVVIGITVVGVALGMVGVAKQKREEVRKQVQTSIEQAEQERAKVEEETKVTPKKEPETDVKEEPQKRERSDASKQDVHRIETPYTEERKRERPRTSSDDLGGKDSDSFDENRCFEDFNSPGCIAYLEAIGFFDSGQAQQQDYYFQQQRQQQLYQQYYYYQQQQQQMFDPNQFMQGPYQQYNPVLQDFYQQMLPGVYPQIFP